MSKLLDWLASLFNKRASQSPLEKELEPQEPVQEETMVNTIPYLHTGQTKLMLQVKNDLERHEAYREYAYPDVLSDLGKRYRSKKWGFLPARSILAEIGVSAEEASRTGSPWTVGHGFTNGVTLDSRMERIRSERKLEEHILEEDVKLAAALPWYKDASFVTKTILINMSFNIGLRGLLKFKNTLAFIKAKDYTNAAANMRKSLWFRQTGVRAVELSKRMETQTIEPQHKAKEKL